jgi:GH15 family glucan-1,4-alpha-glucosidase
MTSAPLIGDYAVIGDGRSAALISSAGSVDWLAWPRFDSRSIFAAILDQSVGGHFRVSPSSVSRSARRYLGDSNVLETTFEVQGGAARLIDLMPVHSERNRLDPERELLRLVECSHGDVDLDVSFDARPGYGRGRAALQSSPSLGVRFLDERALYTLRSDVPLELRSDGSCGASFRLLAGERRVFSLSFDREAPAALPALGAAAWARADETVALWASWARRCRYEGPHRDQVIRSLLALKLLCYVPSGAIVAAPTTSLPERIGGPFNWDYRFAWLRDASLTVRAFFDLGYEQEARAFTSWLLHTTRLTRPELRILYDVYGRIPSAEIILDHLAGHRGSRPVRVRNAAAGQLQLDTYGEVIDAVTLLHRRGVHLDRETQGLLCDLGRYVCANWHRPDHGIWERREEPQHHTLARVMCWTALDRLLELHRAGALARLPAARVEEQRDRIRREVELRGFSPRLQSYTARLDGNEVDASLLLLAWHGFADPCGSRMAGTFRRIRERLETGPGLLYRMEESRAEGEGTFGIASFWAVEFLARGGGTLDDAERAFEAMARRANDVGLFGEEIDPATGDQLGNFPQGFTHIGLLGAAIAIEERRNLAATTGEVPPPSPRPLVEVTA